MLGEASTAGFTSTPDTDALRRRMGLLAVGERSGCSAGEPGRTDRRDERRNVPDERTTGWNRTTASRSRDPGLLPCTMAETSASEGDRTLLRPIDNRLASPDASRGRGRPAAGAVGRVAGAGAPVGLVVRGRVTR